MNRVRTAVAAVVLWCVVVAVGATFVWVVIDRAGQGVLPAGTLHADATGTLPVPVDDRAGVPHRAGATLAPRPSRRTTQPSAPGSSHDSGPSGSSGGPGGSSSSGGHGSHQPRSGGTSSPSGPGSQTPANAQRRSWSGEAGHVVAECQGQDIRLISAFPGSEWRYTILDRGPALVRVRFQHETDDLTVTARCVGGAPAFSTSDDEPGDD